MTLIPQIDPAIFALCPDFTALSLTVTGGRPADSDDRSAAHLARAVAALDRHPWAEAHLEAWRAAYRAFGTKPNRFPCSAEALRKRAVRDGGLRAANAVVDLYNAVSLEFALPVGGEDAAAYRGAPRLMRALGDEPFDTMAEGQPRTETPDPGEVIWRDDLGVTCRRWNWRQGRRTALTPATTEMWFVLERLAPMPIEALIVAGATLAAGLRDLSGGAVLHARLMSADCPTGADVTL